MRRTVASRIVRAATAAVCVAAVVATGCGTEVRGEGSIIGDGSSNVPTDPRPAPGGEIIPPPVNAVVDYQIGGAYRPERRTGVVIRDRSDDPADGVYSVCYLNAFQAQSHERTFWDNRHPDLLLRSDSGDSVDDDEWDEPLLDISTPEKRGRLAEIVDGWITECADKGFSAVEPDNLDSWTRSGSRLTRHHAVEFAALITLGAHARGLAVAQKNAAELTDEEIAQVGFDFAIAEDCQAYSWERGSECDRFLSVYGDRVIEIEYSDGRTAAFAAACRARGDRIPVLLRDRDVVPRGEPGYVNRTC